MYQNHVPGQKTNVSLRHIVRYSIELVDVHDLLLTERAPAQSVLALALVANEFDFVSNGGEVCEESSLDVLVTLMGSTKDASKCPSWKANAHHAVAVTAAHAVSPRRLSFPIGRLTLLLREASGIMCLGYLVDFISDSY